MVFKMNIENNKAAELQQDERVPVTVVVTRMVPPGKEPDFEVWQEKMIDAASKLEGHLGVSVIRPVDKAQPEYVTIFKFDHYSNLKKWLQSDVRLQLLEESKAFAPEDPKVQILTGLESWFTMPGQPRAPQKYKMVALTSVAIFLLVNGVGFVAGPLVEGLSGLARSAVLTPVTCFIMTYWAMPSMTRLFAKWLYP
jgi:antibiotic biosynthesis monooxygenase (ABM) superfamily enzyme